jgi:hypothetical protein
MGEPNFSFLTSSAQAAAIPSHAGPTPAWHEKQIMHAEENHKNPTNKELQDCNLVFEVHFLQQNSEMTRNRSLRTNPLSVGDRF